MTETLTAAHAAHLGRVELFSTLDRMHRARTVLRKLLARSGFRFAQHAQPRTMPQLHMRHTLERLPDLVVPAGYRLRSLNPADIDAWVALLNENGELGEWTHERALRYFGARTSVVLADSFFVLCDATPVATAQLELHSTDPYAPLAELGWVAASPQHRQRGLGYVVCLAVLQRAAARKLQVFLRTDDHRYPAIATYLRLGFEPWLRDPTAESRWQAVQATLARGPHPPADDKT